MSLHPFILVLFFFEMFPCLFTGQHHGRDSKAWCVSESIVVSGFEDLILRLIVQDDVVLQNLKGGGLL